jgi:outer membrane protein assembly factor BamB
MKRRNPCEKVLNVKNVGSLQKLWSYTTGGEVNSSPAVANGVVYVGSEYPDHKLYALNASTGAKWTISAGTPAMERHVLRWFGAHIGCGSSAAHD